MIAEEEVDIWLSEKCDEQSIFTKIMIDYQDNIIEQKIMKQMENPIYHQQNLDDENDENEEDKQDQEMRMKSEKLDQNKREALYNPLEDDENESWITKNISGKKQKPLVCPSCFNQVAFEYTRIEDKQNAQFHCLRVFGINVKQTKIMRNKNIADILHLKENELLSGQILKEREEAINVKILCECECGAEIGYFDINRQLYVLFNII